MNDAISLVDENRLLKFIEMFSSYHTRYYTSKTGVKAMTDLAASWKELSHVRSDIKVELHKHRGYPQPSVVVTIEGTSNQNVIVLGGHGDSINSDDEGNFSRSPGADDNASGVAVLNEILNIIITTQYKPTNSIKIIIYAAEEVGLRGSMDFSEQYDNNATNVLGVIQFDGTNYNGSYEKIVLINDHTDKKQNQFLGKLIDTYLNIPWGYDKCGYACSDHYSWSFRGFVASFPAEAKIKQENHLIHTANDTLEVSNFSATHATNFAKLGLSYLIELDK